MKTNYIYASEIFLLSDLMYFRVKRAVTTYFCWISLVVYLVYWNQFNAGLESQVK